MALKDRKPPKIQRGISLSPALNEAIAADAEKLGKRWNEVAESVLAKAYASAANLHKRAEKSQKTEDSEVELVHGD